MTTETYSLLDTNRMPWRPDPDIPGFKLRPLRVDSETRAVVKMWHVPPAMGGVTGDLPHRHYHVTQTERAYQLSGDFPHWEFGGVGDLDGELVVFRRHDFMDRPPKSIHGRFDEPRSLTGAAILYWNTGPGTGLGEPEAATETITIPFDEGFDAGDVEFVDANIFNTEDRDWQPHGSVEGWKIKPLGPATPRTPAVWLVNVPADWTATGDAPRIPGATSMQWLFLVSGDLKVRVAEDALRLQEGAWLEWRAGGSLSLPEGVVSDGGCVIVCVGHDLSQTTA